MKETEVSAAGTRTTWKLHPDNAGGLGFESESSTANPTPSNRHYLSANGQVIGVIVTNGTLPTLTATQSAPTALSSIAVAKLEYWHQDHQGSLISTTDQAGNVTARYAYDPFGKRRMSNGSYDAFGTLVVDWVPAGGAGTDRGYTGHEHLDDVAIVHMNGRTFDPMLGRFMQSDPVIQDPLNLQNYDRYGYCFNNPLTCTDPTGQSFFLTSAWKRVWHNPVSRTIIIAAAAWYAGAIAAEFLQAYAVDVAATAGFNAAATATAAGADASLVSGAYGMAYSSAYAAVASPVALGAVQGAAAGFVGGLAGSNGNIKAGFQGAITGAVLGGVGGATQELNPTSRVAARAVTAGIVTRAQKGDFSNAFTYVLATSAAAETFKSVVGWSASFKVPDLEFPDSDPESNSRYVYQFNEATGRIPARFSNVSVFGVNIELDGNDFFKQGGGLARIARYLPGSNPFAQFHDTLLNFMPSSWSDPPYNQIMIIPAIFPVVGALVDGVPANKYLCPRCKP